jgi:uncharacterized protein YoxC
MADTALNIIAVVSLTILGLSLLVLTVSLLPLISQASALLLNVNEVLKTFKEQIMPNIVELSSIVGKAKKMVESGQSLTNKISGSAAAITKGLKAGLSSYFKSNKSEVNKEVSI